jgi:hypothetical protein
MPKFVFITFGGPTANFHNAVNRICQEAKNFDLFDEIYGYTENDLKSDYNFWINHGDFIERNRRGYGYWIWKPYLIKKKLNELNNGDFLIYADCGCEINKNGKKKIFRIY